MFTIKVQAVSNETIQTKKEVALDLSNIPVYITVKDDLDNELVNDTINTMINEDLTNKIKLKNNNLNAQNEKDSLLHSISSDFEITELTKTEKEEIKNNPLFSPTILRVQEMIEDGNNITYVNFFMLQPYQTYNNDDTDSIEWWEANCAYLGTYQGYKFIFLESSVGVESSWVSPSGISPSVNWTTLARTVFEFPLSITYGESGGYVKFKVSGDLYIRTVMIRDDHDRVQGYAYYPWGQTQQAAMSTTANIKWPISERPGGTYNYDDQYHKYPKRITSTSGFYGGNSFYSRIIQLYSNEIGYFTHDEYIDVNSLVVDLLLY